MDKLTIDTKHSIEELLRKITSLKFSQADFTSLNFFLSKLNIKYVPKIITVTGTNGKGSTVAILSHILQYNHIDHIYHISPHIKSFNERISYNQKDISDVTLLLYLDLIYEVCLQLKSRLPYHFVSFLCAWLYIQKKQPHWAILEVGVGGRLDSANLFDADIAIITTVALDHCDILGNTIEQIALEKVHIARPNRPLIIGDKIPKNALDYLNNIGTYIIKANKKNNLDNPYIHPNSMACALMAIEQLPEKLTIPPDLAKLSIVGRFQIVKKNPLTIADVAHNPQAARHLFKKIESFLHQTSKQRVIGLFITNQHKDVISIIQSGNKIIDLWLVPDLNAIDSRFFPMSNEQKQNIFPKKSIFFNNHIEAFDYVTHNTDNNDLVVIFGSFVLIGALNEYYDKKRN